MFKMLETLNTDSFIFTIHIFIIESFQQEKSEEKFVDCLT